MAEGLACARSAVLGAARAVGQQLVESQEGHAEALSSARLVFCTLSVAGSFLVRNMAPVATLIIDEAAQATEPETLIPLACQPQRALLAGDPCQLCCMCVSPRAKAAGLERSLMGRLMAAGSCPLHFLAIQYRMHPAIAAFPSRAFYHGRLTDAPCVLEPAAVAPWVRQLGRSHLGPWAFVDVAEGAEARDAPDGSIYNAAEAAAVARLVRTLRDEWGVAVGRLEALRVLTFYSAQVAAIRRALAAEGVAGASVGTVDGSQGAEADVVLLSCVRANGRAALGFVDDWRRLNVAITRAKSSLIIVGHARTLGHGEPGDAPSDLVRAAADANAIYVLTRDGARPAAQTMWLPRARAEERSGAAAGGAAAAAAAAEARGVRPRRARGVGDRPPACSSVPGPPSSRVTAPTPSSTASPARKVGLRKRALERAHRTLLEDDGGPEAFLRQRMAEEGGTDAYVQTRIAEMQAYTLACQQAEVARAEARARTLQESVAVFAPPAAYTAVACTTKCED